MYVTCLVIPVPKARLDDYRAWARMSAEVFKDFGCIQVIDAVGDTIPLGKQTDFRRAVNARDDEVIVLSLKIWPDKASLETGEEALHASGRLDGAGDPPFDPSRLILGTFDPIYLFGGGAITGADSGPTM